MDIAALGAYADADQLAAWRNAGFNMAQRPSAIHGLSAQLARMTLIEATAHHCGETRSTGLTGGPVILWIADPTSLEDVLWYWNSRCLNPVELTHVACALVDETVFGDVRLLKDALERAVKSRGYWSTPELLVYSKSTTKERQRELMAVLDWPFHEENRATVHSSFGQSRPPDTPISIGFGGPFAFIRGEREAGKRMTTVAYLGSTELPLRVDSPVPYSPNVGGYVRIRFSGPPQFSIPRSNRAAALFAQYAECRSGSPEISTLPGAVYHFPLKVPTRQQVLNEFLAENGLSMRMSDKGLLASGVIRRVERPELLRDELVVDAIDVLTQHRFEYEFKEAKKQLPNVDADSLDKLALALRDVRQVTKTLDNVQGELSARHHGITPAQIGGALNRLIETGLASRGLTLICEICGMQTFVEVNAVAQRQCPGCGSSARYDLNARQEPHIYYKLNSMLDRASDQGVLPHILAVSALDDFCADDIPLALPGAIVRAENGQEKEVDVLALVGREVWVGEAKPSADAFTDAIIERDLTHAAEMKAAAYFMICLKGLDSARLEEVARRADDLSMKLLVLDSFAGSIRQVVLPVEPLGFNGDDERAEVHPSQD